jgi:hypothetical protein
MAEKKKPVKSRSNEGRSVRQEDRRRTVAGKGFVGKSLTKREEKKVTKDLKKVAPYAIPGGLAVKGAIAGAKAVKASPAVKKAVAKSIEKRSLKAANSPSKGSAGAKAGGKKYMKDKYFTESTPKATSDKWGVQKRYRPKEDEIKKVIGDRKAGTTARINPQGKTAKAAEKYQQKRQAGVVKRTVADVIKGNKSKSDPRTVRGNVKKSIARFK